MSDERLRSRMRDGTATERDLARAGLVRVRTWNGNGYGNGYGDGDGYGYGDGYGDGDGDGNGYGDGDGNGNGYGNGYGDGDGNGYGDGYGDGDGDGDGNGYGDGNGPKKGDLVRHLDYVAAGTPVVVRSYVSGVIVGRLIGGEDGAVVLDRWRWLRRWEGVGNEGSVYDLVKSGKTPTMAGPLEDGTCFVQQADVMVVPQDAYDRLALTDPPKIAAETHKGRKR